MNLSCNTKFPFSSFIRERLKDLSNETLSDAQAQFDNTQRRENHDYHKAMFEKNLSDFSRELSPELNYGFSDSELVDIEIERERLVEKDISFYDFIGSTFNKLRDTWDGFINKSREDIGIKEWQLAPGFIDECLLDPVFVDKEYKYKQVVGGINSGLDIFAYLIKASFKLAKDQGLGLNEFKHVFSQIPDLIEDIMRIPLFLFVGLKSYLNPGLIESLKKLQSINQSEQAKLKFAYPDFRTDFVKFDESGLSIDIENLKQNKDFSRFVSCAIDRIQAYPINIKIGGIKSFTCPAGLAKFENRSIVNHIFDQIAGIFEKEVFPYYDQIFS